MQEPLVIRNLRASSRASRPEHFNLDGSPRQIPFFDSSKGSIKGTRDEGTDEKGDSRQVRRRKIRVFLFNHISYDPVYGRLPRAARRYWARNTVMPKQEAKSESTQTTVPVAGGN